jgi:hypothetical protein
MPVTLSPDPLEKMPATLSPDLPEEMPPALSPDLLRKWTRIGARQIIFRSGRSI